MDQISEMAGQGTMITTNEKRRRSAHKTRIAMDFDLEPSILYS